MPSAVTTAPQPRTTAASGQRAWAGIRVRGGRLTCGCRQRPHTMRSVYELSVTRLVSAVDQGRGSVLQGGVQGDVDAGQGLADRAAGLGRVGRLGELAIVQAVDLATDGELDAGQLEPTGRVRAERDVGLHVQGLRGAAGLADQRR